MDGIDPGEGGLATGIIMELWQSERRIGEKKCAIATIDQIVRRVQTLAIVAVGEDGGEPVLLDADDAPVAVLANGQPALRVNGQAVRAGLAVFANVLTGIAGFGHVNLGIALDGAT